MNRNICLAVFSLIISAPAMSSGNNGSINSVAKIIEISANSVAKIIEISAICEAQTRDLEAFESCVNELSSRMD